MKHHLKVAHGLLTLLLLALLSCNDPTVIGSDLLSGDELDIQFTDTVTVQGYTITEDSVRTYNPDIFTTDFENFHCGDFIDPVFGRSTSTIYTQLSRNTPAPNFLGGELDSIVLILPYNADFSYGKLDETYSIEVYEMDESLIDTISYYSNRGFSTKSTPIGVAEFVPKVTDSVTVVVPNKDSIVTQKQVPQLRIQLDQTWATQFFNADTSNFNTIAKFQEFFKGLQIRATSTNAGMVSFKMRNALTGLRVYYHVDSSYRQHLFPILSNNVVTAHFIHEYAGSVAADFIGPNATGKDSLFFLQGLSGLNFFIEIPYADAFKNIVVNRAELVLPIVNLPEDEMGYSPVKQILVTEVLTDSTFRVIDDVTIAITRFGDNFGDLFGGRPTTDGVYKLNISAHFQDMVRGLSGKKIRLSIYLKAEHAERVVLAGPKHATTPAKLRLTFTRY